MISEFFKNKDVKSIRNLSVIAHVDHGKSTLTDNLLAEVGLINKDLAGTQLATDYLDMEKQRGITIQSSNVSFEYKNHLFNLTDSPGHVDFNSAVVNSLRGSDGAILVVDVVEGIMTQTETVLGQALNEGLELVLFVNKVDRVVCELYLDSKEIFSRLNKTVSSINQLIKRLTGSTGNYFDFNKNVVFGSALNKWGVSIPELAKRNLKFSDIIDSIKTKQSLSSQCPLASILLDSCIANINSPELKQRAKIEKTYSLKGMSAQFESLPEDLLTCDPQGAFRGVVTEITYDKYAGLLATVRVLSGSYDKSGPLYSNINNYTAPLKTPTRIMITYIKKYQDLPVCYAGTIVVFQGVEGLTVGATVTGQPENFNYPGMTYSRTSVVALAIAPKKLSELKKMIECVKYLSLEDPTLQFEYSEETKQFKLYGVGLLHLQIALGKLKAIYNIQVTHSDPLVEYSETLREVQTKVVSVRTANKLNDFDFYIFKLPEQLIEKLLKNEVTNKNLKHDCEQYGIPKQLSKKAIKIMANGCVYFENTKGCSFLEQTKDNIVKSMELALGAGYNLKRAIKGIGFVLTYANIHMDGLHRGVNQLRGAYRKGLEQIFAQTPPLVVEPIMSISIETPYKYVSAITSNLNTKRGVIDQSYASSIEGYMCLKGTCPLAESIKLSSVLMSISEGRVLFDMELKNYAPVPQQILKTLKLN